MNPQHFDFTYILSALVGMAATFLGRGAIRYGMGQVKSRIPSSVGRSNFHDASAMGAESLVLQSAQMHMEETKEVRKQLDTVNEQRIKEALERGRMIGKVEILEKQQFPTDPIDSAVDVFNDFMPVHDDVLPSTPNTDGNQSLPVKQVENVALEATKQDNTGEDEVKPKANVDGVLKEAELAPAPKPKRQKKQTNPKDGTEEFKIEMLPKSRRKKHIVAKNSNEFAKNPWDIQPLGEGRKNTRKGKEK